MNEVIKILLELRDELYLNDQITMNGVWKLNRTISQIQGKGGVSDSEIGYTAPEVSTYFSEENSCKFHNYIDCEKCDNCENCAWNPDNKYLRKRRVRKAVQAFYAMKEAEGVRKNIQNGEKNGKS